MNVGIAYAKPTAQVWKTIQIADGATVREVIEASGLLEQFPEIDIETQKVGIFGTVAKLDKPVKELGLHPIRVVLHPEVDATIKINVARSEEEAEIQASGKSIAELRAEEEAAEELDVAALFEDVGKFDDEGEDEAESRSDEEEKAEEA